MSQSSMKPVNPERKLLDACLEGELSQVKDILSTGLNPNEIVDTRVHCYNETPLHHACRYEIGLENCNKINYSCCYYTNMHAANSYI